MNASMESVLTGYGDPRLEKFFKPCGSDLVIAGDAGDGTVVLKGQYHGIRQGTGFSHNYYAAFSRLTVDTDTDAVLMTAAEAAGRTKMRSAVTATALRHRSRNGSCPGPKATWGATPWLPITTIR